MQIENLAPGRYQCIATDIANGCQKQIYANPVNGLPLPSINSGELHVKPDTCSLSAGSLFSSSTGGNALQQNNSGTFDLPAMNSDNTFYIEIQRGDCASPRVPVSIKVVDESFALIPNAFTPNGDGRNDTWGVSIIGIIKLKQLRVFNRWGQMMFETTDPGRRWDGRYRGKMLGSGSYFYILFGTDHSGKSIEKKGTVTIVPVVSLPAIYNRRGKIAPGYGYLYLTLP